MSTLAPVRVEAPVRVNLLPTEIAEAARLRKLQTALGGAVLAALAVVGGLYWQAGNEVTSAQEQLDAAQATTSQLQAQKAEFADVPKVYAQVDAAKGELALATANEIHWSTYLTDLALQLPPRTWLTQMQVTEGAPSGAGAPAAGSGDPLAPAGTIGTVTYTGYVMKQQDVAVWLESLSKLSDGIYPYFTQAQAAKIGDTDVVQFTSSLLIKPTALANLRPATTAGSGS